MKNIFIKASLVVFGGGIALAAIPSVPVDLHWVVSYDTSAFDTTDGDLALDEYAVVGKGTWYIRKVPKDRGQFEMTDNPKDIEGKHLVSVRCDTCVAYSEFSDAEGSIVRAKYENKAEYDDLRMKPDAKQPKKTEMVSVFAAREAEAAIALNATTTSTAVSAVASISFSHTVAGSETLLYVTVHNRSTLRAISGVTYNSVSMTVRDTIDQSTTVRQSDFYLVAPTAGANTVAITFTGGNIGTGMGSATSLTGVDQTSPLDAGAKNNGNAATITCTVTTVANNAWVLDGVTMSDKTTMSTSGSNVQDFFLLINSNTSATAGSRIENKTPAGSTAMSWTTGLGFAQACVAASFKPSTPVSVLQQSVYMGDGATYFGDGRSQF